jgi:hypothetical protein
MPTSGYQSGRKINAFAPLAAAGAARVDGDATRGEKKSEECASCHPLTQGQNRSESARPVRPQGSRNSRLPLFSAHETQRHHLDGKNPRRIHRRSTKGRCRQPHALRSFAGCGRPSGPDSLSGEGDEVTYRCRCVRRSHSDA